MSLEFINYLVKEEGKIMSSSKIAHYWEIKFDKKPYVIAIKESLVSNKFRIFINQRKVKEMIASERDKRKGFKFKHKKMEISLKKTSNRKYNFKINNEPFKKGHKKFQNVMNLLTKDKNREIQTKLLEDQNEANFDIGMEKDKLRFEKFKKKKIEKKIEKKNLEGDQDNEVFDYQAIDDDFLNFGDFKSVKTIDLNKNNMSNSMTGDFNRDNFSENGGNFKSDFDFKGNNQHGVYFSNRNVGFEDNKMNDFNSTKGNGDNVQFNFNKKKSDFGVNYQNEVKNNGFNSDFAFNKKNSDFRSNQQNVNNKNGYNSQFTFNKQNVKLNNYQNGNSNNGYNSQFTFDKKNINRKINSEKVISNKNDKKKNIYEDPLKDKNFLNFDSFDFNTAREIVNKNTKDLKKNPLPFNQNGNYQNNFGIVNKKDKETNLISEQQNQEINFL